MHIIYLIYGTFNSGGMERVLANKANWLVAHGYRVTIITTDQQGRNPFFDFSSEIQMVDLGVNFTQNKGANIVKKTLSYLGKQRQYRKRLTAFLSAHKAEVVVSMFGAEVHWLPKIKDGSKKIAEIHFSKFFREQQARGGVWRWSDAIRSRQDEWAIGSYDRFVVLTHEDKGYWGDCPNIEVIHNALSFVSEHTAPLENKRVVSVGRLTHQKGYDMLIEAWAKVAQRHPDWRLAIFGGGEELEQRGAQAAALGVGQCVDFMAPTPQIEAEFLTSSIYALSSRYEGLPMVLLEAMSCSLPPVAFACQCGPRDAINDGQDGILVEPNDTQALAEGICRLIEDPALRQAMGAKAAKQVRQKFAEEHIMAQWGSLFNDVIAK